MKKKHDVFHLPGAAPCPRCGVVLDGATNITGTGCPTTGDYTVCVYCFAVLEFITPRRYRLVSDAEVDLLPAIERIGVAIASATARATARKRVFN